MFSAIAALLRSRRGAAALSFAAMLPVMMSGMGLAIDYSNYRLVQSRLQAAADAGALSAIGDATSSPADVVNKAVAIVARNVPAGYGDVTRAADVTVGTYSTATGFVPSNAAGANAVRVVAIRSAARGNVVPRIFSIFFSTDALTTSAAAVAARPSNIFYEPPEVKKLDSDAWDFNELYAYCYDYTIGGAAAGNRTQMTLISNNSRPNVNIISASNGFINQVATDPPAWPDCSARGQSVSFRLRNIREANQNNGNFQNNPQEYNYYSDTSIADGVESSSLNGYIVETKLCATAAQCNPSSPDAIVPSGGTHNPNVENRPCEPGKYMYFGWEDRPPAGGSDRDYNDLTIQMRCPRNGRLGDDSPRLVR